MTSRLRFHPLVASDLRRAIRKYDAISAELGNRFRRTVDAMFDFIESNPQIFPTLFADVRFAVLKRFPYLVLFRPRQENITVLGVFPGASDPKRWRKRAR